MDYSREKLKKLIIVVSVSLVLGSIIGGSTAYAFAPDNSASGDYCDSVEQGIQQNMSHGFVSCYPPQVLNSTIRDSVEEKSDTKCVCRKKVGDSVQTITLTTSR